MPDVGSVPDVRQSLLDTVCAEIWTCFEMKGTAGTEQSVTITFLSLIFLFLFVLLSVSQNLPPEFSGSF